MTKTPDKGIEQEANEKFPEPANGFWTETQKYHVEKLREAYIAGRSKGLERIKELEAALRNATRDLETHVALIRGTFPMANSAALLHTTETLLREIKELLKP